MPGDETAQRTPILPDLEAEELLGEGVYSRVYRVSDEGADYAVKVQKEHPGYETDEAQHRFLREGGTLARLDHPVLPKVWSVGERDGRRYLVMDYLRGDALEHRLERGDWGAEETIRLGIDIAAGLAELHGAGLVHRDLKPSNIIWDGERAKLVDFGLVGEAPRAGRETEESEQVVGTFKYTAPEQMRVLKRPVGPHSDLYSLGAVLYECCVGEPPFSADSIDELIQLHATAEPPPLADRRPDLPDRLTRIVDSLLEKEPKDRPASAHRVRSELAGLATTAPSERTTRPTEVPGMFRSRRREMYRVGRETILDRLHRHWEAARDGEGGLAVVRSNAESGAAPFFELLREGLRSVAPLLLETRGSEDSSYPLRGIRDLIDCYTASESPERAASVLEKVAEQTGLSRSARGFVRSFSEEASQRSPLDDLEPDQFYGEIARFLIQLGDRLGPTALVVENLQRLDAASRRILADVADHLAGHSVWFCASLDPSGSNGETLIDSIEDVGAPDGASDETATANEDVLDVELEPLDETQIGTFIDAYFGSTVDDPTLVSKLKSASGGAPFVLEQVLDVLVETGVVTPHWKTWRVDHDRLAEADFPKDSTELLVGRMDSADENVRGLCEAAAVLGPPFELVALAEVLEASESSVRNWTETAIDQGLMIPAEGASASAFEFVHDSIRRALLEHLDEDRRHHLHQSYAEWLDDRTDDWTFEIARHYRAGDGSRPERRIDTSLAAGLRAAEEYAYREAHPYLRDAVRHAEERGRQLPYEAYYHLGETCTWLEQPDRARTWFDRAAERATDPLEEAKCRLAQTRLDVSRMNIAHLEDSVRETLRLLEEPTPESTVGMILLAIWRVSKIMVWRYIRAPTPVDGRERERRRYASMTYEMYGVVGRFQQDFAASITELTGRLHAALPLGLSVQKLEAIGTEAAALAFGGRAERAEEKLEEAHAIAAHLELPRAHAYLESVEILIDDLAGHPARAERQANELLDNRADQLPHFNRSILAIIAHTNCGIRGKSLEVRDWFERWKSLQGLDQEQLPPAIIYGNQMMHSRFCGDDAFADRMREAARDSISKETPYIDKLFRGNVFMDALARDEQPEEVEALIEDRRELGADTSEILYNKYHFIYAMYGRRYVLDRSDSETERRRDRFETAVEDLEAASEKHPTFLAHARVGRAELHRRSGDLEEAFAALGRAQSLAESHDNPWVLFEVDRLRAKWLEERERPPEDRRHAAAAIDRAERIGWTQTAQRLRDRYDLFGVSVGSPAGPTTASGSATSNTSRTISSASHTVPSRHIERERQLNALLEVSTATTSLIDPDEVSRVVVDAAIRVLGAQRGMLFLSEDAPEGRLEEAAPRVVRTASGESPASTPNFSRTILEQVVASREPMVLRSTAQGANMGAESVVAEQMRSALAAPLQLEDDLVGIVYLDNHLAEGVFGQDDIDILRAMAAHIPVALETARTAQLKVDVAAERERRTYAEKIREFARDVHGMIDIRNILERLLVEIDDTVECDVAWAVHVSDEDNDEEGVLRNGTTEMKAVEQSPTFQRGRYLEEVLTRGESRWVHDVTRADREREPAIPREAETWLALPLLSGEEVLGLLTLSADEQGALDPGDLEQLVALAGQAGVAIEKTELATIDPLTGLYNRRKFFEVASDAFERAAEEGSPLAALMIDFDNFKQINDVHGHAVGDTVLQTAARRCAAVLREGEILGRYGGDEFAAILSGTNLREAVDEVGRRLQDALSRTPIECGDGLELSVEASIGAAERRDTERDVRDIFERADEAVYDAKRSGKNALAAYSDDSSESEA